jgi:hypothetical protein
MRKSRCTESQIVRVLKDIVEKKRYCHLRLNLE